jgi:hypothetical protein
MSLTYTTYRAQLATLTNIPEEDLDDILPGCIDYAEGRCYRDLDVFVANVRDGSASTSANVRNFNLPTSVGTFIVVDGINVITPAATAPDGGTRIPLQPVSRDFLDTAWPSSMGATVPKYFAYLTNNTYLSGGAAQSQVIFGPWPDAAYRIEVIGKITPTPLSSGNPNTYLTDYLPDLLIAASMVFMSGFMRNYGSQADDPRMSSSWEQQYTTLLQSAATYEARKRWSGASWSSKQPEPAAVPQRG